jgi:hypothetical protein
MSASTSVKHGEDLAEKVLGGDGSDDDFLKQVAASAVTGEQREDEDVPAAQPDREDAQPVSPERLLSGLGGMEGFSDGASLDHLAVDDGTDSVGHEASSSVSTADTLSPYPAVTYFPKQVVPEPLCCKCGRSVDPFKTKLVKKVTESAAYKCHYCNTKHVQLCGIFGNWPVKAFEEQSIEEQTEFWRDKTKGKKEVEDSVMKHIVRKHTERLVARDDGDYLPIGVYKTRGFDTDLILKHCKDKKFEEDKGWCYKVRIHGDSKHTIDELAEKMMLDMKKRGRKRKASRGAGGEKRRRTDRDDEAEETEEESGDDDEEEAEETAAEAKLRKHDEKKAEAANKKAEKDRVAALNKAAKEVVQAEKKAKQEAAKVALAAAKLKKASFTKVISKVQGPIAALSGVINDPVGMYVPQQGMDEAKAALEQLMTIFTECSTAIATMAAEATPPTLESVADILVIAEGKHKAMQALLANARKTRNIPAPTGSK